MTSYSFATTYGEKYRGQFHFSPSSGWIGDVCGSLYYQGKYHMFWWGKATSTDLVHYDEETLNAMTGEPQGNQYWTGSTVVDKNNTASFGANTMIPIYTMGGGSIQKQGISYSTSNAYTSFQYNSANPVLDIGNSDFRDPTVFWYEPSSKWIMTVSLAAEKKIQFYSSTNLKDWTWMSDFGPIGAQEGVWECPDMFQVSLDGNVNNKKWVMVISVGPNLEQYFIGDFNGTTFIPDSQTMNYLNQGTGLDGSLYMGFDGSDYGSWAATGNAFGTAPLKNEGPVNIRAGMATSCMTSDSDTGTLTSPSFTINNTAINFLIGGGSHPDQTCINMIVDGQVVRTATGNNSGILKWNGWDVSKLIGKTATIQIVDNYTGTDWGHIDIDHIMFSDILHSENREHALWVDYGSDFYASRAFRDYDGTLTNTTWLGWTNNWEYATSVPGSWGQGQWSIARNLSLKTYPEGVRLVQNPIPKLQSLRQTPSSFTDRTLSAGTFAIPEFKPDKNTYEIDATFSTTNPNKFGFNLCVGSGRKIVVGYDTRTSCMYIDRSNCTDATIPNFSKILYAPVAPEDNKIKMRIFVDKSSIEVFANSGKAVLTMLTYPGEAQTGLEVFSENDTGTKLDFSAWIISSIWPKMVTLKVNDTDPGVLYNGIWNYYTNDSTYYNNDCHVINTGNVQYTFKGTTVDWYGLKNTDLGIADVYIDGVLDKSGIDCYSTTRETQKMYSKSGMSNSSHTITVVATGSKNTASKGISIVHDYFQVN
ncbi:GH32 C-terminal domain-containing protein [Clostridium frigoris]|uniref:GH32 C-terminal domain-containing protein n=1 Tax=Clostridium frigoris TaxID=205327 RepID=A0ABS6BVC8_9CLOT|nr:GH32 C-terminal domain-containing protein [Clostridium frigoris]MBU3160883.1 GH32 C-terminal domain-containing protein [Clostridium frigoris]